MDLGAPILDVQASVSVSAPTTTSTASSSKVESIISGGVVTAPGYDPIVIAVSNEEPEVEGGVFVPDIPIMQVDNYYTVNEDQVVDKTQVVTHVNKFEGEDVIEIKDRETTIIEGTDNTAVLIVIVAGALILLVLLVLSIRFIHNKIRAEKL